MNIDYKFDENILLPDEIIKLAGLKFSDKTECTKKDENYIIRVISIIGKEVHPMIKIAGYTSWYTNGENGYYITGYDTEKKEFFQIIS